MENFSFIEFKKERDLGAIISDTFKFIRENWKEYFLTVLKIVGPVLVGAVVLIVLFFMSFSDTMNDFTNQNIEPASFLSNIFSWFAVIIFAFAILYTLLSMSSLYFIKSYIENNGNPKFSDVKTNVLRNLWKFILLGFTVTISVVIGSVLCYLPGIYLMVTLSLATSIMVFEGKDVSDSFSHCFTLISGNWWNTYGVIIVVGLLILVLGQVFSVPVYIYQMIETGTFLGSDDPTQTISLFKDPIYLILNVASTVFQFVLYSITLISSAFIYFDLNEQKNQTGTLEQIDSLGEN